ncbi:MAG: phage portal protein [Limnohabitans sp.]
MSLATSIKIGNQNVTVPVTITDRIVNWLSPIAGAKRYRQRVATAMVGGYTGADRTRRANQKGRVREMDADSAILPDLVTLREESQHMLRNNAVAVGAVKTNITKVVGTGLKAKPQIDRKILGITSEQADAWEDAALREYLLATETREFDYERQLPFSLQQGLIFLKALEDGDIFVNLPRMSRPGSPYKLKLQLIEAARVCNKDMVSDTVSLAGGIARDKYGAPEKIHVLNAHPGNWRTVPSQLRGQWQWQELDLFQRSSGAPLCLHLFDKLRPGQSRGVPYIAPVVELIKQLGRYTDAEVMAAVVSGMFSVFITNETGNPNFGPAANSDNPTGDATKQVDTTGMELGYGSVIGLLPGESISTAAPGRPNVAFDPFVMAILRQIGIALELPFEILIKHFTASYSAARAALEEAWDYFNRRRHWLVVQLCQPIYEAVITEAVASERLSAPGFFADPLIRRAWLSAIWIGDAPSQIDPVKEIEAATARIDARISTREEERARLLGEPWEPIVPQIIKEEKLLAGLPSKDAQAAPAKPQPPEDNSDANGDQENQ